MMASFASTPLVSFTARARRVSLARGFDPSEETRSRAPKATPPKSFLYSGGTDRAPATSVPSPALRSVLSASARFRIRGISWWASPFGVCMIDSSEGSSSGVKAWQRARITCLTATIGLGRASIQVFSRVRVVLFSLFPVRASIAPTSASNRPWASLWTMLSRPSPETSVSLQSLRLLCGERCEDRLPTREELTRIFPIGLAL